MELLTAMNDVLTDAAPTAHAGTAAAPEALLAEARTLLLPDPGRALHLAQTALAGADGSDADTTGQAHMLIGAAHVRNALYAEAYEHLGRAVALLSASHHPALRAEVRRRMGVCLGQQAQFHAALEHLSHGLAVCRDTPLPEEEADIHLEIGAICGRMGDLQTALERYHTALSIAQTLGDRRRTSLLYARIGNVYFELNDYTTALDWYLQSHTMAEELNDRFILQIVIHGIGSVQYGIGDYTRALDYHFRSLSLCRELGLRLNEAICYGNIGSIHYMLGNYPDALKYYLKALHMRRSIGDPRGVSHLLHDIGRLYGTLGDTAQAQQYYHEALALCRQVDDRIALGAQLFSLGRIAMDSGNDGEALPLLIQAYEAFRVLELEGGNTVIHEDFIALLGALAAVHERLGDTRLSRKYRERQRTLNTVAERERRHRDIREAITRHEIRSILTAPSSSVRQMASLAVEVLARAQQADAPRTPAPPAPAPGVVVTSFGRFSVTVGGRELTGDDWKRKKTRDVFKLLLLHYRKPLAPEQIIDILWQDAPARNVKNLLWNAVSAIRRALEPTIEKKTPSAYLRVENGCYILDLGDNASIDVLAFRQYLADARRCTDSEQQADLLTRATDLYTGDFLKEDIYEEWSAYERESLKEAYLDALMWLAQHDADHGRPEQALAHARRILEADRIYEDAYELMLTILADGDQIAEAHRLMEQCRRAFERELGSPPPRRLAALAARLA